MTDHDPLGPLDVVEAALDLHGCVHGCAPVQGEGTVRGYPFYFRARGDTWTFAVAPTPDGDPERVESAADGFFRSQHGPDAGVQDLADAARLVRQCAGEFVRGLAR